MQGLFETSDNYLEPNLIKISYNGYYVENEGNGDKIKNLSF